MGGDEVKINTLVTKADLITMLDALRCESLHHEKKDRHGDTSPCPVVQRLRDKYTPKPKPLPEFCGAHYPGVDEFGGSDF